MTIQLKYKKKKHNEIRNKNGSTPMNMDEDILENEDKIMEQFKQGNPDIENDFLNFMFAGGEGDLTVNENILGMPKKSISNSNGKI